MGTGNPDARERQHRDQWLLGDALVDIPASGLLQSLTDPTAWAIHSVAELPTFIKGRAILLGDAVWLS